MREEDRDQSSGDTPVASTDVELFLLTEIESQFGEPHAALTFGKAMPSFDLPTARLAEERKP